MIVYSKSFILLINTFFKQFRSDIEITLKSYQDSHKRPLETVYFGGGTPSLLSIENVDKILTTMHNNIIIVRPFNII